MGRTSGAGGKRKFRGLVLSNGTNKPTFNNIFVPIFSVKFLFRHCTTILYRSDQGLKNPKYIFKHKFSKKKLQENLSKFAHKFCALLVGPASMHIA